MSRFYTTVVFSALLTQGCATMSQDACQTADWRALGFADGSAGQTLEKYNKREAACSKHAITPNRNAYDVGRSDGLDGYCVPDTGFDLGESGNRYSGVCTGRQENEFLAAYDLGRGLYAFNAAVKNADTALTRAQKRHDELDAQLDKYQTGYRDEGLTTSEHNEKVLKIWSERRYLKEESILYWNYAARFLKEQREGYEYALAISDPAAATMDPRRFPGPEKYTGPTKADAQLMLQEVFSRFAANAK